MPAILEKAPVADFDSIDIEYVEDTQMINSANKTQPITFELRSNEEVPSPTVGELVALYYRLIDEMCYYACFNELSQASQPLNAWRGQTKFRTLSLMNNHTIVFDRIYRLCVNNELLGVIRKLYDSKVVHEKDLNEEDVHGITVKITSLEQARIFLEGLCTRVFSSNFGFILSQHKKTDVQKVFKNLNIDDKTKSKLEKSMLAVMDNAILKQTDLVEQDIYKQQGITAENEQYILLQSYQYLKYNGVFKASLKDIGLTALSTCLLGIDAEQPNVNDIGLLNYSKHILDDDSMWESFVDSVILAHRHHYPNKVLSTLY